MNQGTLFKEKTEGQKSCETVPLRDFQVDPSRIKDASNQTC
jgi:hypothetical protein